MKIFVFIKKYSIITYYLLTFAISLGGFLLVGSSKLFLGTSWETDPMFQLAVLAMLAGPPIAGILLTFLITRKVGVHELISRMLRWRVDILWYVIALLIAPLIRATVLLVLSLFSFEFLPAIFRTNAKRSLLILGIIVGLAGGFVEELGWTGLDIPRLLRRYSILNAGLIVGILWGMWYLLQMWWVVGSASSAAVISPFFYRYASFLLYRHWRLTGF